MVLGLIGQEVHSTKGKSVFKNAQFKNSNVCYEIFIKATRAPGLGTQGNKYICRNSKPHMKAKIFTCVELSFPNKIN
jgi:hypothetical protein